MSAEPGEADAALAQFAGVVLDHPRLGTAVENLEQVTERGLPQPVTLLLGPTGVGKSTAISVFKKDRSDVVVMQCEAPSVGDYQLNAMHWQLLAGAAKSCLPHAHRCPDEAANGLRRGRAMKIDEQRLGVLTALVRMGAAVIVYDEAQVIARTRRVQTQAAQLDVIRGAADRTGIPHVLAGTYALTSMVFPNDQLARRTRLVHFPPYYWDSEDDRNAFGIVFGQLLLELPFPDPSLSLAALEDHARDVFLGSAGCVGQARDWLVRALKLVLTAGGSVIDWEIMEAARLDPGALLSIARAIAEYRDREERADLSEVERSLGMRRRTGGKGTPSPETGNAAAKATGKKGKKSPCPGKRRPEADPVGLPAQITAGSVASSGEECVAPSR